MHMYMYVNPPTVQRCLPTLRRNMYECGKEELSNCPDISSLSASREQSGSTLFRYTGRVFFGEQRVYIKRLFEVLL